MREDNFAEDFKLNIDEDISMNEKEITFKGAINGHHI
jgi:hypothetical protein